MTLDQKIRQWIDRMWQGGGYVSPTNSQAALLAVLDLHNEFRIYGECGHRHTEAGNDVLDVENVGLTCEDGYQYSICRSCCADGDSSQAEQCVDTHEHPCWTCPTHHAIASALGIDAAAVSA